MPLIKPQTVPVRTGSIYPAPYDAMMAGRSSLRLGDAGGLTQFGVNLVRLDPGALSSLRHWHSAEDEFLIVTEGRLTLVDDTDETVMIPGDCAAFPAGDPNGHHVINRSDGPGAFLVVGTKAARDEAVYADVDMKVTRDATGASFTRRDGSPLPDPAA